VRSMLRVGTSGIWSRGCLCRDTAFAESCMKPRSVHWILLQSDHRVSRHIFYELFMLYISVMAAGRVKPPIPSVKRWGI
jgi:hypothetical protein